MAELLDAIDRKILRTLQDHGRLPVVELADRVNLTKTPCSYRMRRLEKSGYIRGYRAELDPVLLDAGRIMIVMVSLSQTSDDALETFNEAVRRIPEVQGCYMIAGNFDYLLKVRTKDVDEYRSVLGHKFSKLPHVHQTHSFVVMELVKDDITVPVT
ncbi:Lrp/AsnC family transcriptional regulator [Qingshengfaniella alkalisoli]|uniref:Winged helix-turn-helix transcriptional regulator n=1 Tax=Qingshengfaniella alkalisoli TaxID=2599296 RepID=A0A5B8IY70_9RHOB|nr:Lrp/AsnC ligand binding domain-containing protein [Qingshengfaniella alkalisoli]QDY70684.1 winged helix-turn-helix transcriptional regulator [Qingshengfaniella alkalisoli]